MASRANELSEAASLREQQKLKWAVEFAEMEVDKLKDWEILKLKEELLSFLGRGPVTGGVLLVPLKPPFPGDYERKDFKVLSDEFWSILDDRVRNKPTQPIVIEDVAFSLSSAPGLPGRTLCMFQGTTRAMGVMKLVILLANQSIERIRKCANKNCSKLFYKIKRQEYHHRHCMLEARPKKKGGKVNLSKRQKGKEERTR